MKWYPDSRQLLLSFYLEMSALSLSSYSALHETEEPDEQLWFMYKTSAYVYDCAAFVLKFSKKRKKFRQKAGAEMQNCVHVYVYMCWIELSALP